MIEEARGRIEYDEFDTGTTLLLGKRVRFLAAGGIAGRLGNRSPRPLRWCKPPPFGGANVFLSQFMRSAALVTVEGASLFMIATHATQISRSIAEHVRQVENAKAF